jgi:molecular chaperone DnaK
MVALGDRELPVPIGLIWRNQADRLVYSTEKFLAENDEKVPADVKAEVKDAIADLKKAIEGNDLETIKTASKRLAFPG